MGRTVLKLAAALAGVLAAAGCGGSAEGGPTGRGDGPLRVVTTVAPITSIVAAVAGDAAEVRGVVPEGADSHTFEPAPSTAETLARADVVFVNGLFLEEPVVELVRQVAPATARVVELGNAVLPEDEYLFDASFPREGGRPNPHLWTDPTYARRYAEVVRDTLADLDREHAGTYAANHAALAARIDDLDAAMRQSFATLPRERRQLLTYHDAYAYVARSYGWDVIGAVQVASFQDPSPKEVAELIDQVRRLGVPAVFGSEVFPSPVLEQIGKAAGVRYVDVLRDDDLPGAPGQPEHSWLGLLRFDYVTMVEALGGDASALRALDVSGLPDRAEYPQ